MKKNYDILFRDILGILRREYAGRELVGDRLDPRYYNTAVGQAWHDRRLDELTFLRYISQMLACTGDRHLRLSMAPSASYTPWSPGFLARRYGDELIVTHIRGEERLRPGDAITAVNGGSLPSHRASIQKNFFYADEPGREDWAGLLRMAETVTVRRSDGREETLPLEKHPPIGAVAAPRLHKRPDRVILDLRNVPDLPEEEALALLSRLLTRDTPYAELFDTELYVSYTPVNCAVKAASLTGTDGAEPFLAQLRERAGQGFLPESADDGLVIPGRGDRPAVVLTDTWTRDGAEALALAARRAGAVLIGRATLGTIDLWGDVSLRLDDRYTLTWPTALTVRAYEGKSLPGQGLAPDLALPWSPRELSEDVLLREAEKYPV